MTSPHRTLPDSLFCQDLEVHAGEKALFSGLSFAVGAASSLVLQGSNGSGKTSLLRTLAGISRPHSGCVRILGQEIWPTQQATYEHRAPFLSHVPAFFLDHYVLWNLEFYTRAFGVYPKENEFYTALERTGLSGREWQLARTLSSGQKRRLTLAGLWLLKPSVLFADEPTNGLDSEGVSLCLDIFKELMEKSSCSLIIASHDSDIIKWCQKSVELANFLPKRENILHSVNNFF